MHERLITKRDGIRKPKLAVPPTVIPNGAIGGRRA